MISLAKNKAVDLTKETGGSLQYEARVKWDVNQMNGKETDIDIMTIRCGADKKCIKPDADNTIFYNNLISKDDAIKHSGDNKTGSGDGWDEVIAFDFSKLDSNVKTMPVIVTMFDTSNGERFGDVSNLTVQIFDTKNQVEVAEYIPELMNGDDTVLVAGEFVVNGDKVFFKAIGEGSTIGVPKALEAYGVEVA